MKLQVVVATCGDDLSLRGKAALNVQSILHRAIHVLPSLKDGVVESIATSVSLSFDLGKPLLNEYDPIDIRSQMETLSNYLRVLSELGLTGSEGNIVLPLPYQLIRTLSHGSLNREDAGLSRVFITVEDLGNKAGFMMGKNYGIKIEELTINFMTFRIPFEWVGSLRLCSDSYTPMIHIGKRHVKERESFEEYYQEFLKIRHLFDK